MTCSVMSAVIRFPLAFPSGPGPAFDRTQGYRLGGGGKPGCHLQRASL